MSQVTVHNGTVYLAGQVADDATQDVAGQTRQVLAAIDALLERAGTHKGQILMAQIFLPDMADFAVEDLRKWKQWDLTGKILELYGKKDFEATVIRRAILRFALQSPEARAVGFVRDQRQRDSDWVKDTEELLKLEN